MGRGGQEERRKRQGEVAQGEEDRKERREYEKMSVGKIKGRGREG